MSPRIYVGTYAKYNSGSIAGKWLDLEDYASKEEFLEAARELHKDETDPELMFQDFEGFPTSYYSESSVPVNLWDWLDLDEDERELLEVYRDNINDAADIDEARDAFAGRFNSEEEWAGAFLDDTGELNEIPENLRYYFDYAAYASDARLSGDMTFIRHNGECWAFHSV